MTGKWNCLLTPCMTWNLVLPILVYASNEGKRKDRHEEERVFILFQVSDVVLLLLWSEVLVKSDLSFFVLVLINNNNNNDKMLFIALYLKLTNPWPSFIMITLSINGEATNTISTDLSYPIPDCLRCWIDCRNGLFYLITWCGFRTKMYMHWPFFACHHHVFLFVRLVLKFCTQDVFRAKKSKEDNRDNWTWLDSVIEPLWCLTSFWCLLEWVSCRITPITQWLIILDF